MDLSLVRSMAGHKRNERTVLINIDQKHCVCGSRNFVESAFFIMRL